jgi:hypothetical protein
VRHAELAADRGVSDDPAVALGAHHRPAVPAREPADRVTAERDYPARRVQPGAPGRPPRQWLFRGGRGG